MRKRQKERSDAYEAQWDNGAGSHHQDYDPDVPGGTKASRDTEELYNAIVKNDISNVSLAAFAGVCGIHSDRTASHAMSTSSLQ